MKNMRLKWDDAPVFLAVARSGTLTGAADMLGTGIATVSRRVQRLEEALGMPLFVHHQTGYKLTDEGAALLPRAEALEEAMLSFRAGVTAEAEVTGHVRLATAENLANPIIIPTLPALLGRHPHLTLDVITDVATANLHRREADLAVRMVRPTSGNVTIRRIGTIGFGLYGSPGYMAARRAHPEEGLLENDRVIGWSERQNTLPTAQWIERALRGRAPVLMTSTLAAQMSAAQAGIGLAVLPHFLAREAGLQPLSIEMGLDQPIWLVLHSDLSASQRVRVVADHLVEIFRQNGDRLKQARAVKPR